jgi:multidrug resistance efflux pump
MSARASSSRFFAHVLLITLIAVLVSPGWLPQFFPTSDTPTANVTDLAHPPPQARQKLVVCYGYADLDQGVTALHPSQPGRVAEILVKENDAVPAGAVLLRLEDRTVRSRAEEAKGALDAARAKFAQAEKGPEQHRIKIAQQEAALEAARHRVSAARHTLAARKEHQKIQAVGRARADPVTAEELAAAVDRVRELEAEERLELKKLTALRLHDPVLEVDLARADVATMQARVRQAEQTLEEHQLKAPYAGRVLRVFVSPGDLLSPQLKRMAVQFCPDGPRIIRAEVDQAFARRVEVGLPALVEDDGHSGSTWRGHVARIADWYTQRRLIAEEQLQLKDVRTLERVIALDPDQPPLRIGQRVRVTISRPAP